MKANVGDWVEIENILLTVGKRAPQTPDDTKNVPLIEWMKGFLITEDAQIGDEVEIETLIGRKVKGMLSEINPKYKYDYGYPIKEFIDIGVELRKELESIK